ncbi:MAG TPA: Type 1 glutamine amidotransferase-like domain-containing protein [Acidimicrobiales bacterium]|nr:Type 1 glutamine amidotransferase-like domain-containing protein [Acidimicrobiales bacterium]
MAAAVPTIIASSIGFDRGARGPYDWRPGPIFSYAAERARAGARPRLCLVTTALGDDPVIRAAIQSAFEGTDFDVSVLSLFPMPSVDDVRQHLLSRDVICVVLGGVSAGSLCWHSGGTTDSFGPALVPITNCLGLLPWSNCPHYDSEEQRRPLYQRLVADGTLTPGYATDDGAALVYEGTELVEVVADREGAAAYSVRAASLGAVEETLVARCLR